jgi:hypothetical protein
MSQLFPRPRVHADLAALAALAATDENRAARRVEVALGQPQRFVDAQPGAPEHDEWSAQTKSVGTVARGCSRAGRRDDAEARGRERRDLQPPAVPELREAVQEAGQRSLARLDVVQRHLAEVGLALAKLDVASAATLATVPDELTTSSFRT